MPLEKSFNLNNIQNRYPIWQGGMGIGVSLTELASAVGVEGGIGTVSSVSLDQLVRRRLLAQGEKVEDVAPGRMDVVEAVEREIFDTKQKAGVTAINIMVALPSSYEQSVEGAIRGGVDAIISGAGPPFALPSIVERITGTKDYETNLIPMIASAKGVNVICRKWNRSGYRLPDAFVLEGPLAGGHIGWSYKQIDQAGSDFYKKYDLFKELLPEVLDAANSDGRSIPVIVAGGIATHEDIVYALDQGASAVQMGSRFAMTKESGFTDKVKQLIIDAKVGDVVIADDTWGSACGYPFKYLKDSPLAKEKNGSHFCICSTLKGAAGLDNSSRIGTKGFAESCPERDVLIPGRKCPALDNRNYAELVTLGNRGAEINEIISVKDLMAELVNNSN